MSGSSMREHAMRLAARSAPAALALLCACAGEGERDGAKDAPQFPPTRYECTYTILPPAIDGKLDERAWEQAAWTAPFVHVLGPGAGTPLHATRAKLLWDVQALYVAVELQATDVGASETEHDGAVYEDDNLGVLLDPNLDGCELYVVRVNARGAVLDQMAHKPLREGGTIERGWEPRGIQARVTVQGTLDEPKDKDEGWTLELAIPWNALQPPKWVLEDFGERERKGAVPKDGETWRMNLSRIHWPTELALDAEPLHWTWAPLGQPDLSETSAWAQVVFRRR